MHFQTFTNAFHGLIHDIFYGNLKSIFWLYNEDGNIASAYAIKLWTLRLPTKKGWCVVIVTKLDTENKILPHEHKQWSQV